jgi:hypothetical protein
MPTSLCVAEQACVSNAGALKANASSSMAKTRKRPIERSAIVTILAA